MYQNKKSISPLVTTIILLAFAVALGSVVMSWGKGLIESKVAPEKGVTLEQNCDIAKKCFDKQCITTEEYNQINDMICPS